MALMFFKSSNRSTEWAHAKYKQVHEKEQENTTQRSDATEIEKNEFYNDLIKSPKMKVIVVIVRFTTADDDNVRHDDSRR